MFRPFKPFLLLNAALLTLSATPALANDASIVPPPTTSLRVSDWLAPLDDYPNQDVRLFGVAQVPANEGVLDRALRLVAGAGLVGLAATDPLGYGTGARVGAGAVGAVLLWTSLTGSCLAYIPFGASTR